MLNLPVMKKVIALIFIAGLVLAMSGCTIPGINKVVPGQSNPTATPASAPTATPKATATATATATLKPTLTATVAPTAAPSGQNETTDPEVAKYKGTWDTTYGMMTFTVKGNHASGVYTWQNGTVEATLSDDGKTMDGMWYEEPTRLPPNDAGRFTFTLSEDGNTIEGEWWYGMDDYGGGWYGTRVSDSGAGF